MAINLAEEFKTKIDERFKLGSKTDGGAGHDYEFDGTNGIKIYSVDVVANSDYTRSGSSRYGTLAELGDSVQTLNMTKDRSFTFSIDRSNAGEQYNIKQAATALKRQWDEVCIPEIDAYRLNAWATGRGLSTGKAIITHNESAALTKANILDSIFTASAKMSDELVPNTGRTLYIPEMSYVKLKLADCVVGGAQLNAEAVRRGYRGTIDGMEIVSVPAALWPVISGKTLNYIIKVKSASVDPVKLKNLRVQKTPVGIDGDVVEGHFMYDSFVLDSRCKGVLISVI